MLRTTTLTLMLALAGCAVGPDYARPQPIASAAPPFIGSASPAVASTETTDAWWRLYQDPVLDRLIADALVANKDIAVAVANLDKARAALRAAGGARFPSASLDATGGYQRLPSNQALPGFNRSTGVFNGGVGLSYEVDLFGRISRGVEAARGDVAAADADRDAVRVAIVAETTRAYADLGSLAERIRVARRITALVDQSVALTAKRYEAGRATRLDTSRAATLRDQVRASVPPLEAERDAALYSLATLTGRTPRDLPSEIDTGAVMLHLDRPLPIGDGRALLARRPDVRAAERRLAAETARIGVATADLYPTITLGASVGSTSTTLGSAFTGDALRFFTGGLLSWNFLNQEPARARIAASRAETAAALARFDKTVLVALQETETALSAFSHELDRRQALTDARSEAATAVKIVRAQLREGRVDSLSLIDAERSFADTEAALAASNARVVTAQVDLFRALGGGWQIIDKPKGHRPPLVRPIHRGRAPFEQAGSGPVRLQMRRVDHELVGLAAFGRKRCEDAVEHAEPAPTDEAVVDRLVRFVVSRCITPAQSVLDHEDDSADHPPVVDPWHPVRQRKVRLDPAHLRRRQSDQITHDSASSALPLNQPLNIYASCLTGPESKYPGRHDHQTRSARRTQSKTGIPLIPDSFPTYSRENYCFAVRHDMFRSTPSIRITRDGHPHCLFLVSIHAHAMGRPASELVAIE